MRALASNAHASRRDAISNRFATNSISQPPIGSSISSSDLPLSLQMRQTSEVPTRTFGSLSLYRPNRCGGCELAWCSLIDGLPTSTHPDVALWRVSTTSNVASRFGR